MSDKLLRFIIKDYAFINFCLAICCILLMNFVSAKAGAIILFVLLGVSTCLGDKLRAEFILLREDFRDMKESRDRLQAQVDESRL